MLLAKYKFCNRGRKKKINDLTRQVSGKVRVVHEAVARKLYTLKPDWNMDVIEPEKEHQ